MAGEAHKLDSIATDAGSLGAAQRSYDTAVHPKPNQKNQVSPKGTGNERVGRLVIGKPHESTVGAPKETIIKLSGKHGERGTGPGSKPGAGYSAGTGRRARSGPSGGFTSGMGGRH